MTFFAFYLTELLLLGKYGLFFFLVKEIESIQRKEIVLFCCFGMHYDKEKHSNLKKNLIHKASNRLT